MNKNSIAIKLVISLPHVLISKQVAAFPASVQCLRIGLLFKSLW